MASKVNFINVDMKFINTDRIEWVEYDGDTGDTIIALIDNDTIITTQNYKPKEIMSMCNGTMKPKEDKVIINKEKLKGLF